MGVDCKSLLILDYVDLVSDKFNMYYYYFVLNNYGDLSRVYLVDDNLDEIVCVYTAASLIIGICFEISLGKDQYLVYPLSLVSTLIICALLALIRVVYIVQKTVF